ncbi:hypothetical protein EHF33_16435 (plasmid) [Deinococcus psychrotolerans]|uniref:Uncharacterized protein n=2 Tax=Deinococcus psychrotolerans TaxID=2489213 RepID=A0A3G8YKG4_9DEIO|nr:hypothetical protein EHF33_16435 [Deinococcus psychrotolerans]
MRLATAADEIEPLGDARVKENEAFFGLLLLSRVVVRLGDFSPVPLEVIAGLYVSDFAFLQALYIELNSSTPTTSPALGLTTLPASASPAFQERPTLQGSIETSCPQCGAELILDLDAASDLAPA